jgi:hypothetical protein
VNSPAATTITTADYQEQKRREKEQQQRIADRTIHGNISKTGASASAAIPIPGKGKPTSPIATTAVTSGEDEWWNSRQSVTRGRGESKIGGKLVAPLAAQDMGQLPLLFLPYSSLRLPPLSFVILTLRSGRGDCSPERAQHSAGSSLQQCSVGRRRECGCDHQRFAVHRLCVATNERCRASHGQYHAASGRRIAVHHTAVLRRSRNQRRLRALCVAGA